VRRTAVPAGRQRNNWTVAIGIVLALAVLVVAGVLVGRSNSGSSAVPAKVSVNSDVPAPIQSDVKRLQQVVDEKR
jgi:hypothetical protein